jgi:hypothetical protein
MESSHGCGVIDARLGYLRIDNIIFFVATTAVTDLLVSSVGRDSKTRLTGVPDDRPRFTGIRFSFAPVLAARGPI